MAATISSAADFAADDTFDLPEANGGEEVPDRRPAARVRHRRASRAEFTLLAHPELWDVFITGDGVAELLPSLVECHHTPGVGGCRQTRDENGQFIADPSGALAARRKRGFIPIPRNTAVTAWGQEWPSYIHRYPGTKGWIYMERWSRLYILGDSSHIRHDEEAKWTFLRRVRDEILGGEPDEGVKRALKSRLQRERDNRSSSSDSNAAAKRDVATYDLKLAVFDSKGRSRKGKS